MTGQFLNLGGNPFFVRRWGDPTLPKLLLLHGFPEYSGAWDGLAQRLAGQFHCIAPDQRGYGQSWCPSEPDAYRAHLLAQDMAMLIRSEGGPMAVMSHDWGAAVAYALAIQYPDLISRLIVANGVHPGPFLRACAQGGAQSAASRYINELRRPDAEQSLSANGFTKLFSLFPEDMDFSWMTAEKRAAYKAEWARPGRLSGMLNWYRASPVQVAEPGRPIAVDPIPVAAARITMPHLLIWGQKDTALLPESLDGLEAYVPDLTCLTISDADHWVIHQKTSRVAGAVAAFLS